MKSSATFVFTIAVSLAVFIVGLNVSEMYARARDNAAWGSITYRELSTVELVTIGVLTRADDLSALIHVAYMVVAWLVLLACRSAPGNDAAGSWLNRGTGLAVALLSCWAIFIYILMISHQKAGPNPASDLGTFYNVPEQMAATLAGPITLDIKHHEVLDGIVQVALSFIGYVPLVIGFMLWAQIERSQTPQGTTEAKTAYQYLLNVFTVGLTCTLLYYGMVFGVQRLDWDIRSIPLIQLPKPKAVLQVFIALWLMPYLTLFIWLIFKKPTNYHLDFSKFPWFLWIRVN